MTRKLSLTAAARQHIDAAKRGSTRRSAQTIVGGHEHMLQQTVIALAENESLHEHDRPGEATIYVVTGRVRLTVGDLYWDGAAGDVIVIPDSPHALHALQDSAVLLTVARSATPAPRTPARTAGKERT